MCVCNHGQYRSDWNTIDVTTISESENEIYSLLKTSLDSIPDLPEFNHNGWQERNRRQKESYS